MRRNLTLGFLALMTLEFAAYTGWVLADVGLVGMFQEALGTASGRQVAWDFLIVLTLAAIWIWNDARARGANAIGWVALTFATGSFGPLLYLMKRTWDGPVDAASPVTRVRAAA